MRNNYVVLLIVLQTKHEVLIVLQEVMIVLHKVLIVLDNRVPESINRIFRFLIIGCGCFEIRCARLPAPEDIAEPGACHSRKKSCRCFSLSLPERPVVRLASHSEFHIVDIIATLPNQMPCHRRISSFQSLL